MTASLALLIVGLALVDSTSLGTSLVPLWLLLVPGRIRWRRLGAYYVTITSAYFVMGLLVAAGVLSLLDSLKTYIASIPEPVLSWSQFGVGALIVLAGVTLLVRTLMNCQGSAVSRLVSWRNEAMTASSSKGLIRLAVVAFAIEAATMVPYIGAIGLMVQTGLAWPEIILWVAFYCFIMILPALVLTVIRAAAHDRIESFLTRMDGWLERNTGAVSGSGLSVLGTIIAVGALN